MMPKKLLGAAGKPLTREAFLRSALDPASWHWRPVLCWPCRDHSWPELGGSGGPTRSSALSLSTSGTSVPSRLTQYQTTPIRTYVSHRCAVLSLFFFARSGDTMYFSSISSSFWCEL